MHIHIYIYVCMPVCMCIYVLLDPNSPGAKPRLLPGPREKLLVPAELTLRICQVLGDPVEVHRSSYPDPWADPKSRSTLQFYTLCRRSSGVRNWGFYFLDPFGGLGKGPCLEVLVTGSIAVVISHF